MIPRIPKKVQSPQVLSCPGRGETSKLEAEFAEKPCVKSENALYYVKMRQMGGCIAMTVDEFFSVCARMGFSG